jgi:hypothetical protein
MENEKVAKFFIGTLLDETIETIEVKPQEYTYENDTTDYTNPEVIKAIENQMIERLSIRLLRLDFVATIKTKSGELRKVLIEIQKANNPLDVMRFRNYLAEQYKKQDRFNSNMVALPITTIYILGFDLYGIETPCIKVERNYKDLVNNVILDRKSDFVEKLTHDSFVVQVERITGRYQTTLDKLLSIFEQNNFIDDSTIIKQYNHEPDFEDLKLMTDILHHSGTNPVEKKRLEDEQEAWRTIDALTGGLIEKEKGYVRDLIAREKALDEQKKILDEQNKALEEQNKTLKEKQKAIDEQTKAIGEKNKELGEKDKELDEKDKELGEKDKELGEKDKELGEKDKELGEKDKELGEKDKAISDMKQQMEELKKQLKNNK